jgi:hypothetical protein
VTTAYADVICSFAGPRTTTTVCDESPVNIFLALASQPLGGMTGQDWIDGLLAGDADCGPAEPVTIDRAEGVVALDCYDGTLALVTLENRGYFIWLYGSGDVAWFRTILATVSLAPQDAVDPAPSPSS